MVLNMPNNLQLLAEEFNKRDPTVPVNVDLFKRKQDQHFVEMPCQVSFIGDQSYGKFPREVVSD